MASALVVCPSCSRHVRTHETVCPFCSQSVPSGIVPAPAGPRRPYVGKGATALALASALVATGCGGDDAPTPTTDSAAADSSTDTSSTVDSSADSSADSTTDSTTDSAMSDSAADADVFDEGGPTPLYK